MGFPIGDKEEHLSPWRVQVGARKCSFEPSICVTYLSMLEIFQEKLE